MRGFDQLAFKSKNSQVRVTLFQKSGKLIYWNKLKVHIHLNKIKKKTINQLF